MDTAILFTLLRYGLIAVGSWAVGRGWMDDAAVEQIVGAVMTIATVAWGLWASRPAAKIEQVAALPNVKRVVTDLETATGTKTKNIMAG